MLAALVVVLLAAAAPPSLAHHSFAAEFDSSLPVSITGIVTKVDWRNPHIWIYVDVTETDGRVTHWEIEGGAPTSLMRAGWRQDSLKVGDRVTVDGFRAHRKETMASMRTVTRADGKAIFSELTERALERSVEGSAQ
jgi:hypothetical protein